MTYCVCSAPDMTKLTINENFCSIDLCTDVPMVGIGALQQRSVDYTTSCHLEFSFYKFQRTDTMQHRSMSVH